MAEYCLIFYHSSHCRYFCCYCMTDCIIDVLFRYRPTVTVDYVQTQLGYQSDSEDRDALIKFLTEQGAKLNLELTKIDCKVGLIPPVTES